jgi:hypothetical protein
MYDRGLFVASMLCGISDSSSSVSSKINGQSEPPIYTRYTDIQHMLSFYYAIYFIFLRKIIIIVTKVDIRGSKLSDR